MENNIAGIPIDVLKPLAIKYEESDDFESLQKIAIKINVARCARISYQTLGDNPKVDFDADIKLHDRLVKMGHWSPMEHVAKVMSLEIRQYTGNRSGNFEGFLQYRKDFPFENRKDSRVKKWN